MCPSVPLADCDPGVIFGCGHQLIPGLNHLPLHFVQSQLAHQRAEQHCGHGICKSKERKRRMNKMICELFDTECFLKE